MRLGEAVGYGAGEPLAEQRGGIEGTAAGIERARRATFERSQPAELVPKIIHKADSASSVSHLPNVAR